MININNNNITKWHNPSAPQIDAFEKLYLGIRQIEKRVYNDAEVELLPLIHHGHTHYKEWEVRKRSANRLVNFLKDKNKPLFILEVGCGNGWLTSKLAGIPFSEATGIDINKLELEQAKRVFGKKNNLSFFETDLRSIQQDGITCDTIIFAASIQYFDSLKNIISLALSMLKEGGEIHIIDSFIYKPGEIEEARRRTSVYFKSLGYEEMDANYFHPDIDSFKQFNYKIQFDPSGFKNKIFRKHDIFPWISISNK